MTGTAAIPLREAARVWARVALQSFGGPAGQIAVMSRILIEEKRWIGEGRFLHALNYCMLLPGPEAQQLATYIGWLMHGWRGGLLAGGLFVLPGFLSILALSFIYALHGDVTFVAGLFFGLKPAVLAVVIEALIRVGKRALRGRVRVAIAALAFIAIFFLDAPFPLVVFLAGLTGLILGRINPAIFTNAGGAHGGSGKGPAKGLVDEILERDPPARLSPNGLRSLATLALWGSIWALPIAALAVLAGRDSTLVQVGLFFSRVAVVTFGGAYAVLTYVAQQAVENYHWLQPGEMLTGLGMAETTPGPLIMVVQFVGFMAAWRAPGAMSPLAAATLASVVATWVTFAPCFLWIFLGAPYIETLRRQQWLTHALTAVTAAVVGVILNLAVWFALHTLFGQVDETSVAGMRLQIPQPATFDPAAAAIAALAFTLIFWRKWGMLQVLGVCAAAGAIYQVIW